MGLQCDPRVLSLVVILSRTDPWFDDFRPPIHPLSICLNSPSKYDPSYQPAIPSSPLDTPISYSPSICRPSTHGPPVSVAQPLMVRLSLSPIHSWSACLCRPSTHGPPVSVAQPLMVRLSLLPIHSWAIYLCRPSTRLIVHLSLPPIHSTHGPSVSVAQPSLIRLFLSPIHSTHGPSVSALILSQSSPDPHPPVIHQSVSVPYDSSSPDPHLPGAIHQFVQVPYPPIDPSSPHPHPPVITSSPDSHPPVIHQSVLIPHPPTIHLAQALIHRRDPSVHPSPSSTHDPSSPDPHPPMIRLAQIPIHPAWSISSSQSLIHPRSLSFQSLSRTKLSCLSWLQVPVVHSLFRCMCSQPL